MNITFTGIDTQTTRTQAEDLLADPRVELGVLYTRNPDGRNRYPTRDRVSEMLGWCCGRSALHVCGSARDDLFDWKLFDLVSLVSRVQVNGILGRSEMESLCHRYAYRQFITQHTPRNAHLLAVDEPNHAVLVDGSGGCGIAPDRWERPHTSKAVGFAGGLGPRTITAQLPLIRRVAIEPFWIDMEGQIRTDDWFDVQKALEVLRIVKQASV